MKITHIVYSYLGGPLSLVNSFLKQKKLRDQESAIYVGPNLIYSSYLRFMLLTLTWAAERGFEIGPLFLRYYQILFFTGFLGGFYLMKRYFQKEGLQQEILDNLLVYTVISTIIGARLGHVFFYDWAYYRLNIGEIFMPWKGGLASHGAAIVIPLALYYFSKTNLQKTKNSF